MGEATDTIFTEERQDAKIVGTGSTLLIVHSLLLPFYLKEPQYFSTSLKIRPTGLLDREGDVVVVLL